MTLQENLLKEIAFSLADRLGIDPNSKRFFDTFTSTCVSIDIDSTKYYISVDISVDSIRIFTFHSIIHMQDAKIIYLNDPALLEKMESSIYALKRTIDSDS